MAVKRQPSIIAKLVVSPFGRGSVIGCPSIM
jgi:hypothetical protein